MLQRYRLLTLLADGHSHSGEELGSILGIGRSAVWKLVRSLEDLGLDIYAVRGKGYRLASPMELLDRHRILAELDSVTSSSLGGLELFPEIDSTNRYLMDRAQQGVPSGYACFAESQQAGRGRRGRSWVSPFGTNIYLSVFWRFDVASDALQGLSLAVGVTAAAALASLNVPGVGLKWPNDLVWRGRKLGGVLLEMVGESSGPWLVVSGLGLNVGISKRAARLIDQPWVDLRIAAGRDMDRNQVAGRLLQHMLMGLERFALEGFLPFRQEWEQRDQVRDKPVVIKNLNHEVHGIARGVDGTGALLLSVNGKIQRVVAGELSLRILA